MKTKLTYALLMGMIFASCQKEITDKQLRAPINQNDVNAVSEDDIITFLDQPGQLIGLTDYNDGSHKYVNDRAFNVQGNADSLYPKRFAIRLIKSTTVKVNSITLFLDGR